MYIWEGGKRHITSIHEGLLVVYWGSIGGLLGGCFTCCPIITAQFGSFQLSDDGKRLLYVAEREKPKSCSFFQKVKGLFDVV